MFQTETLDAEYNNNHAAYGKLHLCTSLPPVPYLPLQTSPKSTITDSQTFTCVSDKSVRAQSCPNGKICGAGGLSQRPFKTNMFSKTTRKYT